MSSDKARTAHAAQKRYAGYLQRSLSCVNDRAQWFVGPSLVGDAERLRLSTNPDRVRLATPGANPSLYLRAVQSFHTYYDRSRQEYRVATDEYSYYLIVLTDTRGEAEILGWDWHPPKPIHPHIHVRAEHRQIGTLRPLHVPSGRVLFEDVLQFAIDEFDVKAKRTAPRILTEVATRVKSVWSWS